MAKQREEEERYKRGRFPEHIPKLLVVACGGGERINCHGGR